MTSSGTPPLPGIRELTPLVAHHGALGDVVMLTAMLQELALRWGRPCDVLSGAPFAQRLLHGLPFVGTVRYLGRRKRPYWTSPRQWHLVRWLRERGPSPCWVVEARRHPVAPWSRRTRLEWLLDRAGIAAERVLTTRDLAREPLEHAVAYQARLARLEPPGAAAPGRAPERPPAPLLQPLETEIDECRAWLEARRWRGEPLVLVQAPSRRPRSRGRWPRERWLELVREVLSRLPEARVLLLGVPAERRHTRVLAAAARDRRVWDVASELPLRRLLALQTLAHSMVSVDTGPAHTAAAVGCPVVVLQGVADPRRNRPLGDPGSVQIVTAFGDRPWPGSPAAWRRAHDMAAIPVADVVAAWERLAR